jgi:hypothetical protein
MFQNRKKIEKNITGVIKSIRQGEIKKATCQGKDPYYIYYVNVAGNDFTALFFINDLFSYDIGNKIFFRYDDFKNIKNKSLGKSILESSPFIKEVSGIVQTIKKSDLQKAKSDNKSDYFTYTIKVENEDYRLFLAIDKKIGLNKGDKIEFSTKSNNFLIAKTIKNLMPVKKIKAKLK